MSSYYDKYEYLTLNSDIIKMINQEIKSNPSKKILIEIPNTRGISSELIKKLDSSVLIRIAGAYDEERVKRLGNVKYQGGETGQYYTDAVIYTKNEVGRIISEMEKIEKTFEGQDFSDMEKLVHIYGKLKAGIMYDPKFENKLSAETRSLRGLITKQTVCAGYAVILKEMLDRQGIQCEYVSGTTKSGGGHAWNVVTIGGKHYPIDLTWDNTRFRSGKLGTYEFLGQKVEKFKKNHIPHEGEPCKNYELSEFNMSDIKNAATRMIREKDYDSTTYYGTRKNGSKFIISQVGDAKINEKEYYRYYYAEKSNSGKIVNQKILYSDTNVAELINRKNWRETVIPGYEEAIDNVLFSKENIADSISKGTCYIGGVIEDVNYLRNVKQINKSKKEQDMFKYPYKEYERNDGSTFIVQKMLESEVEGININEYHIFEGLNENGKTVLKRNIVFSEQDFLNDSRWGIPNDFLSRDRLDRKVGEAGGYIGYYSADGYRTYNSKLVKIFKSTENTRKKAQLDKERQKLTQGQMEFRKKWVQKFIQDYEATEDIYSYDKRKKFEDTNMKTVLESLKQGDFYNNYDNEVTKLQGKMNAMARLLKAADNLTIEGGQDYLESFINLPEVNKILLRIRNSQEYKDMNINAEISRKSKIPQYGKTRAQVDKEYAEEYLRKLKTEDKKTEIESRKKMLVYKRIIVSKVKDIKDIPKQIKQIASLIRVLARQEGKRPSGVQWEDEMGWYIENDTCKTVNKKTSNTAEYANVMIANSCVTPLNIQESTIKKKVGKNEINSIFQEIKQKNTEKNEKNVEIDR